MNAAMLIEVDQFRGASGAAHGGFQYCFRFAGKGDHAAVMVGVAGAMKNV